MDFQGIEIPRDAVASLGEEEGSVGGNFGLEVVRDHFSVKQISNPFACHLLEGGFFKLLSLSLTYAKVIFN